MSVEANDAFPDLDLRAEHMIGEGDETWTRGGSVEQHTGHSAAGRGEQISH